MNRRGRWHQKFMYMWLVLSLGMVMTGCTLSADADAKETVEIGQDQRFLPGSLTIEAGTTVIWHNRSDYVYMVSTDPDLFTVETDVSPADGADPFTSEQMYPGETWSYQFTTTGTYIVGIVSEAHTGAVAVIKVN